MNAFELNFQFNDYSHFLEIKKQYEIASNNIVVITDSHKLKGSNELVISTIYDRITLGCKAGKERACKSKGLRKSSTFKRQCPFKVRIGLVNNKLTVKESSCVHENHRSDDITFRHYPENLRLNKEEIEEAKKMIACGGNKQRIKYTLMKDRQSPVPLKALHNLQTKMKLDTQQLGKENELEELLKNMREIPNALVEVVTSEDGELIGVYFQDQRMLHMYDKYPEVLFFDATHNLNNRKMPLFIQSGVDGNGDTEIVTLYICKSESRESVDAMINIFQKHNPAWEKTKVIIGDKDFADRAVYSEKFPSAVLQICLFHVCQTFNREITQSKRDISKDERDQSLEIIQEIVYSRTEEEYKLYYNQLVNLKLPKVITYFNQNWHPIKNEWTLHGRNQHANYMNSTNNRLESLNGKLKMIGNRYANLLSFFKNLSISVTVISSERDIKVINRDMKVPRVRFTDETLERYNGFLTPFIYEKIEEQYELRTTVNFLSFSPEEAIVESIGRYKVANNKCTCLFFSSMILPCKHIFKFLSINSLDLFVPNVCAVRWTKSYYDKSHPVFNSNITITAPKPIYVNKIRVLEEKDRFKKTAKITKEINSISTNLSTGQYTYFLDKIRNLRDEMTNEPPQQLVETSAPSALGFESNDILTSIQRDFLSSAAAQIVSPNRSTVRNSLEGLSDSNNSLIENGAPTTIDATITCDSIDNVPMTPENTTDINSVSAQNTENIISSASNVIRHIKLPSKIVSVGRPKGSKTTVIGTKRKVNDVNLPVAKKIFLDKCEDDKALTILQWLTGMTRKDIVKKKVSDSDVIGDRAAWNRLRNTDILSLYSLKKYVSTKCFTFILSEIDRITKIPWCCATCENILRGNQVMCSSCLDWFHYKCVGFSPSTEEADFFCDKC